MRASAGTMRDHAAHVGAEHRAGRRGARATASTPMIHGIDARPKRSNDQHGEAHRGRGEQGEGQVARGPVKRPATAIE